MDIKYIFCISTGRSGTAYLSKLLGTLRDVKSFHEQKPVLHAELMQQYMVGQKEPLKEQLSDKLNKILAASPKLYIDTSHVFIKGFGWELPNHLVPEQIAVVVLKRDRSKVVESTIRVDSGPFDFLGRKWILVPYKNALIDPPIGVGYYRFLRYFRKALDSLGLVWVLKAYYQGLAKGLVEWYYEETYALAAHYKQEFPFIHYVDADLEDLNTWEGFRSLVDALGLIDRLDIEAAKQVLGVPKNLKLPE